jgi:hypothetical protein
MKVKESIACWVCSTFLAILFIVTEDATCLALGIVMGWVPAIIVGG